MSVCVVKMDASWSSGELDQIDADVLIIGGGFGGIWAALRAAEVVDNVVLLEKAYVCLLYTSF